MFTGTPFIVKYMGLQHGYNPKHSYNSLKDIYPKMTKQTPYFKAIEMEEFLDIYFYHPFGLQFAKLANKLNMTPDQVSYISLLMGLIGGLMFYSEKYFIAASALIVFSSVLDSSDGQLARMTGKGTLKGRILDGMIGYVMHAAIYIAFIILYLRQHGTEHWPFIFILAVLAGAATAIESSMYDYYRTTFAQIVKKRELPNDNGVKELPGFFKFIYAGYHIYQKAFAASHLKLMEKLREKYKDGRLPEEESNKYLNINKKMIKYWNTMGDNTRIIAVIIATVGFAKPEYYFYFIIAFMLPLLMLFIKLQANKDALYFETKETK